MNTALAIKPLTSEQLKDISRQAELDAKMADTSALNELNSMIVKKYIAVLKGEETDGRKILKELFVKASELSDLSMNKHMAAHSAYMEWMDSI